MMTLSEQAKTTPSSISKFKREFPTQIQILGKEKAQNTSIEVAYVTLATGKPTTGDTMPHEFSLSNSKIQKTKELCNKGKEFRCEASVKATTGNTGS